MKVYTGDEETAEDSFVNMNGSFYNGIICDENGNPVYEDGTPLTVDENGTTIERYKAEDGTLEYVMTL